MTDRNVRVILSADDRLSGSLDKAASSADKLKGSVEGAGRATDKLSSGGSAGGLAGMAAKFDAAGSAAEKAAKKYEAFGALGKKMVVAGAAIGAGVGLVTKAAMDWEDAFTGVKKTVDGVDFGVLEGDLRQLAKTMPVAHAEIAGIAQAAGQLGIKGPDIAAFTKTTLQLGAAIDGISAEEAATSIAQIANVMGTFKKPVVDGITNVDRFASSLVHLGNTSATTEGDILSMAQRLASVGNVIGLNEQGVLALAAGLSSMGIKAELGGGVMSRTMLKMNSAVMEGAEGLDEFAKVSGRSSQEFAAAWRADPMSAITMFVEGMGAARDRGEDLGATLKDLGFTGTQDLSVLLALAGGADILSDSIRNSNEAWASGDKAAKEAATRYATSSNEIKLAWNQIKDAAIDMGAALAPAAAMAAKAVGSVAEAFGSLPGPVKSAAGALGAIASIALVAGGGIMMMVPKIAAAKAAMVSLGLVSNATVASLGRVSMAAGTAGKALGAFGLVTAGVMAGQAGVTALWGNLAKGSDEAGRSLQEYMEHGRGADGVTRLMGQGLDNLGDRINVVFNDSLITKAGNFFSSLNVIDTARATEAIEFFKEMDSALANMASSGSGEQAAAMFRKITDEATAQGIPLEKLTADFPQYDEALKASGTNAAQAAEEIKKLPPAQQESALAAAKAALELKMLDERLTALPSSLSSTATAALASSGAVKDLGKNVSSAGIEVSLLDAALNKLFTDTFSVQAATDAWNTGLKGLTTSLTKSNSGISDNSAAGIKNREVMRTQVKSAYDLIKAYADQGVSAGELIGISQMMAEDLGKVAIRMGMSKEAAKVYTDALLKVPDEVATNVQLTGDRVAIEKIDGVDRKVKALPENSMLRVQADVSQAMSHLNRVFDFMRSMPGLTTPYVLGGAVGRASGGPMIGPGTGTSDSIPAMLSNGEHVLTAEEVTRMGGHGAVYRMRRAAMSGTLPQFAAGGAVLGATGYANGGKVPGSLQALINVSVTAIIDKVIPPKSPIPLNFELSTDQMATLRGPDLIAMLTGIDLPKLDPAVQRVRDGISGIAKMLDDVVSKSRAKIEADDRALWDSLAPKASAGTTGTTSGTVPKIKAGSSAPKLVGALASSKAKPYLSQILAQSALYGVAPELIAAQINAESGWNPRAVSSAGAKGLSQFMPGTAKQVGLKDPFNANQSIAAMAKLMGKYAADYRGDINKMLAAYNAGPGNVKRWSSIGETRGYVNKIGKDAGVSNLKSGHAYNSNALHGGGAALLSDAKRSGTASGAAMARASEAQLAATKKAVASKTSPEAARSAAIANALGMVGRGAYKWGGGHSSGYYKNSAALAADCSGFVGWAVGNALGKESTSTAAGMLGNNRSLGYVKIDPKIAAKTAGALMGNAGHIVMSMGDGTVVESYKSGQPVRRRAIAARDMKAASWNTGLGKMTKGTADAWTKGGKPGTSGGGGTPSSGTPSSGTPSSAPGVPERDPYVISQDAKKKIDAQAKAVELIKQTLIGAAPQLEQLALEHSEAANNAKIYADELVNLKKEMDSYATSVAKTITDQGKLSALWKFDVQGGTVTDLRTVIRNREQLVVANREFAATVKELSAAGLNKTDVADIIAMGAEQGGRLGKEILEGRFINDLNATRSELDSAAAVIGQDFGKLMYADQVTAAEELAKAWADKEQLLKDTAYEVGMSIQDGILKGMGISDGALSRSVSDALTAIRSQWLAGLGMLPKPGTVIASAPAPVTNVTVKIGEKEVNDIVSDSVITFVNTAKQGVRA